MKDAIVRFSGKNIPVTAVAKIMGKDQQFVRQAMIEGLLPIGVAFRKKRSSQYDFYISPKLLYDFTGFFFDDDLMDEVDVGSDSTEVMEADGFNSE